MNRFLVWGYFAVAFVVSVFIWMQLPKLGDLGENAYKGGFLVPVLILLLILQITFVVERMWSLNKAKGRGSLPNFLVTVRKKIQSGDVAGAIQACGQQRGSAANVMRAGLERYSALVKEGAPKDKIVSETQAAIQEANGLEVPLLERNLIALSTIASISTMIGLLGTVLGMIRSFRALGHSGAVDASSLATGISEALVNTAGGLMVAILGIVMYNVFVTRVDGFNYMMDEASYEAVQLLAGQASEKKYFDRQEETEPMLKKMRRIGIAIDMTPMVDVAFLLLIFFMCTTQFKPPEKDKITLPDSNSNAKSPEAQIIAISVTSPKTIQDPNTHQNVAYPSAVRVTWRQGKAEVEKVLLPDVVKSDLGRVLSTARAANPAARVIVKMDKDASFGVMSDMMSAFQEANATRFNVQTNLAAGGGAFNAKGAAAAPKAK